MSHSIQVNDPIANSPLPLSAFTIEGDNLKAMVKHEPVMKDIVDAKEASQALAIMFKAVEYEECTIEELKPHIQHELEKLSIALLDLNLLGGISYDQAP